MRESFEIWARFWAHGSLNHNLPTYIIHKQLIDATYNNDTNNAYYNDVFVK